MKLYHCFPRVRSVDNSDQLGLKVLEGIVRFGMVLTPEWLVIPPNPDSDRLSPPSTKILQRRACFTLLGRKELLSAQLHRAEFGAFAIGLDTQTSRDLGIVPTFYYYGNGTTSVGGDNGLSQAFLHRLAELRRLCIAVAKIEAVAESKVWKEYRGLDYLLQCGMSLADEPELDRRLASLKRRKAQEVVSYLHNDRVPAWNLVEWVELMLSAFQTADSNKRGRHLAYFAQREWRLIQFFSNSIGMTPLSCCKIARQHFAECLQMSGSRVAIDDCFLLSEAGGVEFRDYIAEVVVPQSLFSDASGLVKQLQGQWQDDRIGNDVVFWRSME